MAHCLHLLRCRESKGTTAFLKPPLGIRKHVDPALHDPGAPWLPQHDWPALIQYFVPFVPVQQLWPALHETFPQQKPAEAEQNFAPLVFVQQTCEALQNPGAPLSPQHDWPALMQYFTPFVSVQQPCPALQGTLPQQKPPEGVQTGGFADVQHVVPGLAGRGTGRRVRTLDSDRTEDDASHQTA